MKTHHHITVAAVLFALTFAVGISDVSAQRFGFGPSAFFAPPVLVGPPALLGPRVLGPRVFGPRAVLPVPPLGPAALFAPRVAIVEPYAAIELAPYPVPVQTYEVQRPEFHLQVPGFELHVGGAYSSASAPPYVSPPVSVSPRNQSFSGDLAGAARRLEVSLRQHPNGEVWLEFLMPGQLAANLSGASASNQIDGLGQVAERFQGVMANPELAWLTRLDGFRETASALKTMTGSASDNPPGLQPPAGSSSIQAARPSATSGAATKPAESVVVPSDLPLPTPTPDPRANEPTMAPNPEDAKAAGEAKPVRSL